MFKKTNKHSNGLQRKMSWILHTRAQTYMAANKICTISFDHNAKGTESWLFGLVICFVLQLNMNVSHVPEI